MYSFSSINLFRIIYEMSDIILQQFVLCLLALELGQKIHENTSGGMERDRDMKWFHNF